MKPLLWCVYLCVPVYFCLAGMAWLFWDAWLIAGILAVTAVAVFAEWAVLDWVVHREGQGSASASSR